MTPLLRTCALLPLLGLATATAMADPTTIRPGSTGSAAAYAPTIASCHIAYFNLGTYLFPGSTLAAQSFKATSTAAPTWVMFELGSLGSGADPTITVRIYTDNGSGYPGALLTSTTPLTVTGLPNLTPGAAELVTAYFPSPVTLTAGTSYVLRFEAANSGIASVTGRTSNPCPDGKASFSTDNGVTYADTGMGSGGADYYFWLGAP